MTPELKAKELVDKFEQALLRYTTHVHPPIKKECALIAVEEILNADPMKPDMEEDFMDESFQYWKQVKREIEKL